MFDSEIPKHLATSYKSSTYRQPKHMSGNSNFQTTTKKINKFDWRIKNTEYENETL